MQTKRDYLICFAVNTKTIMLGDGGFHEEVVYGLYSLSLNSNI